MPHRRGLGLLISSITHRRSRTRVSVEIRLRDKAETMVTAKMSAMREWLDHQRFEPSSFQYTFEPAGLVFKVDFKIEGGEDVRRRVRRALALGSP